MAERFEFFDHTADIGVHIYGRTLAELFARAELKRGACTNPSLSAESVDWVTRADNPRLRGAL